MKTLITPVLLLAAALFVAWAAWMWIFCRFYVPPGSMAVVTAKVGKALPAGQILAQKGQKGVQEDVLGEGRHFLNPWTHEHRIVPAITILPGKVGVVTSKVGADLPPGEFIAERGQKGIWKSVLGPGRYRMNPVGYSVEILDAISIPIGYAGIVTSLAGNRAEPGGFAGDGEKGIRKDVLQPGLYFVNPKQFKIDVLEIGVNQVSLQGKGGGAVITKGQILSQNRAMDELNVKVLESQLAQREDYLKDGSGMLNIAKDAVEQAKRLSRNEYDDKSAVRRRAEGSARRQSDRDMPATSAAPSAPHEMKPATPAVAGFELNQNVEFPSRDGFAISLDMTVEFELQPDKVAIIFRDFGDLPAMVEKVIIPQILSISRLKGSAYRAVDFIVGEGREKFQVDLTDTLRKSLGERHVAVHNALIRHVNVPGQILAPIQQASVAQEQDLTNREKQNTARKQAELNTEQSLIEQRGAEVAQETAKLKAEIMADQEKLVAEIHASTLKAVAEIEKQTALVRAEKVRKLGKAQAETVERVEGERAKGMLLRTGALGDPMAFNLAEFSKSLDDDLEIRILHAGSGTLWTDLEKTAFGELGGAKVLRDGDPPAAEQR